MNGNEDNLIFSIAYFDGDGWNGLDTGNLASVTTMKVFNSNLYFGGVIEQLGGINTLNFVKWNGSSWSACDKGVNDVDGIVTSLSIFDEKLFLFGKFLIANYNECNNVIRYTN